MLWLCLAAFFLGFSIGNITGAIGADYDNKIGRDRDAH